MAPVKMIRDVTVLDTSVLIHDPEIVNNCHRKVVVIPYIVLEELDRKKSDNNGDVAASARHAIRNLERLFALGDPTRGIPTPGGAIIFVETKTFVSKNVVKLDMSVNDNQIIGTALRWEHRKEAGAQNSATGRFFSGIAQQFEIGATVLVSKDINLRVKARACSLTVEDYQKDRLVSSAAELYTGIVQIPIKKDALDALEAAFYQGGARGSGQELYRDQVQSIVAIPPLLPNACCIFQGERSILALYRQPEKAGGDYYFQLITQPKVPNGGGKTIRPRNVGQAFAYHMLSDPSISLVAVSGFAGTGKTLLALAAGLEKVKPEKGKPWYDQIICVRPTQELGNSIGFLKGTLPDKMKPWALPIMDALQLIGNGREHEAFETPTEKAKQFTLDDLLNDSLESPVKVEPSNFMQGRSLHHKYFVIDEVQNLRPGDVKKLITRAGKGTKVVLVGDVEQVESPYLDAVSNGLSYLIERMKGQPTFGHVTLWESERSPLAELAAKLL
jgi:PhoH-like ATPase